MGNLNIVIFSLLMTFSATCFAQDPAGSSTPELQSRPAPSNPQPPQSFDQVLDRVVEREHFFMAQMRQLHPLVETYIQDLKNDPADPSPVKDHYFLGRLDMTNGPQDMTFMGEPKLKERLVSKFTNLYSMKFLPLGFAQMIVMDGNFQRKFYDFTFVRREFLGEIRCLVIDVHPKDKVKDKDHSSQGRFVGRIWVEDENFNVVRFNGTYNSKRQDNFYLHFDSWRLNMRPGVWLPAYVYSEESDLKYRGSQKLHYKSQTRLWGYDLHHLERNEEFTQIVVDSPQNVNDKSEAIQDATPVESERRWQREAEDNAIDRLLNIGLLAPVGDVDKVLQTVVNNLIVTNNLEIQPEVRTRVLLTSPLESFTIGHTIVISRGMLDVLPDEASLAMVLAHELSHIALDHRLDTKFAFNDRMFFPDQNTFERLDFARPFTDEEAADKKALELLTNSPYKDKLGSAGLFLKALQLRAPVLKNLIRPHLGNSLANGPSTRLSALLNASPNLEAKRTDQIAALPLGGRIKLDPWSDRVELVKTKAVALVFPTEKMPFEVTPFFPYLTRMPLNDKVAASAPGQ
ncbi:MAG: M48 family metalloprotease [Acidobacteriota bacterium]|nr:M48 family metalloprotease [Acidobacteriota bacterium]